MKRLVLTALAMTLAGTIPGNADPVLDWNATFTALAQTSGDLPPVTGRKAAIIHAAIYDAVNGIARKYEPYFVTQLAPGGARQEAAAVQAAYTTLLAMYPTKKDVLDARLAETLAAIPGSQGNSQSIAKGLAWGQFVADEILAWRAADGFSTPHDPFFGGTFIGEWRSIPNGTLAAILPSYRFMTPFAVLSADQFRPGPPPALSSAEYAADVNEVKALGAKVGSIRTDRQTELARLWAASAVPEENTIARSLVPTGARLVDKARLFALLNIAAADAFLIGFDAKYTYNLWRPFHAIRMADLDDNPATEADPTWEPIVPTPNHQEYPSFHGVVTGSLFRVLMNLLGDNQTFTLEAPSLPGISATYHSFSDAVAEVKEARIWGGMHFRTAVNVGQNMGYDLADYLVENILRPRVGGDSDLNHDGCVSQADLALLMAAIRSRTGDLNFDINGDERIDIADARALVLQFTNPGGTPCE